MLQVPRFPTCTSHRHRPAPTVHCCFCFALARSPTAMSTHPPSKTLGSGMGARSPGGLIPIFQRRALSDTDTRGVGIVMKGIITEGTPP